VDAAPPSGWDLRGRRFFAKKRGGRKSWRRFSPPGLDRDITVARLLGLIPSEDGKPPSLLGRVPATLGRREEPPRCSTDRTAGDRLAELMAARGHQLDARLGPGDVVRGARLPEKPRATRGAAAG